MTEFEDKCNILADLWLEYRTDEDFQDFIAYNDIGLPLAYSVSNGIVETTEQATSYINESWDLFVEALGIDPEGEYTSLEQMFDSYNKE